MLFKLTLDRFPAAGVGVEGPSPKRLVAVLDPNWLDDPNEDLRPPPTVFCKRGLAADGELLMFAGLVRTGVGEFE